MLNALKARFRQGYRTGRFPDGEPELPDRFRGRPELAAPRCPAGCSRCVELCPTGAVNRSGNELSIDTGRCLFCNACAEACPAGAIQFSREYRMSTFHRDRLVADGSPFELEKQQNRELLRCCRNSLKIRQVSAGGCGACELDFNVLNTLAWDMGRFGIQVVASPRHADCLLITGPVTANMRLALEKTYAALPRPAWVIACGCCAISGGLYADSPETAAGVEELLHPDLYVPGCPPHPTTLLDGLLRLMGRR